MSQLYHPHQSKGLRQPRVTITRQRCPVTGHLMGPGEGDTVVIEHLDREGKPKGRRTSMRVFAEEVVCQHHWCRAHNAQVVV